MAEKAKICAHCRNGGYDYDDPNGSRPAPADAFVTGSRWDPNQGRVRPIREYLCEDHINMIYQDDPEADLKIRYLPTSGYRPGGPFGESLPEPVVKRAPKPVEPKHSMDDITRKLSVFKSFQDLLDALGGYRPTIRVDMGPEFKLLADEYDKAQAARGDLRRAFRG